LDELWQGEAWGLLHVLLQVLQQHVLPQQLPSLWVLLLLLLWHKLAFDSRWWLHGAGSSRCVCAEQSEEWLWGCKLLLLDVHVLCP
jgi:hypothetical protein